MKFRSVAQRRWMKRNKPALAKKVINRNGERPKANSKKRKRRKSRG